MDYTCKDTIIENMKDFGCDEETIHKFIDCFEKHDKAGQKKILKDCRDKIMNDLHENQKKVDLLDYMAYQLERCNCL